MVSASKFDIAITNPPYDRNLHLKILEKVIPHCEETINISPIRWLQDPLAKYKKNSDYNKFKESVAEHIEKVEVVDANKLFNIGFWGSIAILKLNNENNHFENKFSDKLLNKILEKNSEGFPLIKVKDAKSGNFVLARGIMSGNLVRDNKPLIPIRESYGIFKDFKSKGKTVKELKDDNRYSTIGSPEFWECVEFKTYNEAKNFFESLKTTFYYYVMEKIMIDMNVPLKFLPFMSDYTHPWTNKRFCDYFNITGYISDTEAEPGSEWEEILNTMEKYK